MERMGQARSARAPAILGSRERLAAARSIGWQAGSPSVGPPHRRGWRGCDLVMDCGTPTGPPCGALMSVATY